MPANIVLDASVWVSHLIPQETHYEVSTNWLKNFAASGGFLIIPTFFMLEVAASVSRVTGQTTLGQEAITNLKSVEGTFVISVDTLLIHEAIDVACTLRLRAGDSIYVALAHELNLPLVSWDKEQLDRSKNLVAGYTPDNYPFQTVE